MIFNFRFRLKLRLNIYLKVFNVESKLLRCNARINCSYMTLWCLSTTLKAGIFYLDTRETF